MANTQAQFGFQHFGYLPGYAPDYQQIPFAIQSTYSTVIGFGDVVLKSATGGNYIIQGTPILATASAPVGIFVGCEYTPASGLQIPQWSPWWPGVTAVGDAIGYVISAPGALFRVASYSAAIVTANIGQAINFTTGGLSVVASGQGYSRMTVDPATLATTAAASTLSSLPFKVVSLFPGVGNGSDPTTNFNWCIVTWNNQQFKSASAF